MPGLPRVTLWLRLLFAFKSNASGNHGLSPCVNGLKRVVVAVVRKNNSFLLVLRNAKKNDGGLWAPVTGWIEDGETPLQAAARELAEEVGAHTSKAVFLFEHLAQTRKVNLVWVGVKLEESAVPRIVAIEENTDIHWFSLKEIEELGAQGLSHRELFDRLKLADELFTE
jgi:8-oxo-dGTP pyrophosphatase MutT (NUDIX family)